MPWDPSVPTNDHPGALKAAAAILECCSPRGDQTEAALWGAGLIAMLGAEGLVAEIVRFDGPFGGFAVGTFRGSDLRHPIIDAARRSAPGIMTATCRRTHGSAGDEAHGPLLEVDVNPLCATIRRTGMHHAIVCDPLADPMNALRGTAFVRDRLGR